MSAIASTTGGRVDPPVVANLGPARPLLLVELASVSHLHREDAMPVSEKDEARFWAKVEKTDTCWLWTACLYPSGYGQFSMAGRMVRAHRVSYELHVGPIPTGLQIDHTCHNDSGCLGGFTCPHRRCVNPAHLEPVTQTENARRGEKSNGRKTHCPQNHPYDATNTSTDRLGTRHCRVCDRERKRAACQKVKSMSDSEEAKP